MYFRGDLFRLKLRGAGGRGKDAVVTITTMAEAQNRLRFNCTACETMCEHIGAAVSLVLEEKTALGLAADARRAAAPGNLERAGIARAGPCATARSGREPRSSACDRPIPRGPGPTTRSPARFRARRYRVALRGEERGRFVLLVSRLPHQHAGHVQAHPARTATACGGVFRPTRGDKPYRNREAFVHVLYGEELTLRLQLPDRPDAELVKAVGPLADGPIDDVRRLVDCLARLERLGRNITVYPDAEELIQRRLFERHMSDRMAEIQKDPARHPLRKQLLEGRAAPVSARRHRLCRRRGPGDPGRRHGPGQDDPGRGRGRDPRPRGRHRPRAGGLPGLAEIAVAERNPPFLRPHACSLSPAGPPSGRRQYDNDSFFTVCNYEQVLRDILAIERVRWDLIILDEGQRIKNWESKTARVIKGLKSPFALVLSGTPLENRLDELYSVVQFVDDRRLPPAFRFFHRHRVVDEKGKVLGYKNLDQLRENLRPILLRRTRESVLQQLPPRTSEIVRIPPTDEQMRTARRAHARSCR